MRKHTRQCVSATRLTSKGKKFISGAGLSVWALSLVPMATAEISGETGPWAYELNLEGGLVLSLGEDIGPVDREGGLFELAADFQIDRVLENGAEIGFRTTARGQRDHPSRAGFAGCLGTEVGGDDQRPLGAFSGISVDCAPEDKGVRAAFEAAYAYIDGGYGELIVGKDAGIAARFYEGPVEVLSYARSADPILDPSGVSAARLRNNLTGPSLKISYATPRLLGLRAGVSFTPEANSRGLDWDPNRTIPGIPRPDIENVLEVGVNMSRRLRDSGVRLRAGLSYATGDIEANRPGFSDQGGSLWGWI